MKTCIKMSNGNVYVVELSIEEVVGKLEHDDFAEIPGTGGRDDFYIHSFQVCAVYPATPASGRLATTTS